VGVYFEDVPVAIPCIFNAQTQAVYARNSNSSIPFQLGEEAKFDNLNLPYECSVEAYVDTVDDLYLNDSREWVPCPHSIIPVDVLPRGATGHTGPAGAIGATGPMGPPGPPASNSSGVISRYYAPSSEPSTLNIVELVWLCVLTVVVVLIILVIIYLHACRRRSKDDKADTEAPRPAGPLRIFSTKRSSRTPSTRDDAVSRHAHRSSGHSS